MVWTWGPAAWAMLRERGAASIQWLQMGPAVDIDTLDSAAMEMLGYVKVQKRTSPRALKITSGCHRGVCLPLTARSAWWCIVDCILVLWKLMG